MGIAEMGFYFLIEIQVSFFVGIRIFEDLRFRKKFFFLIQILGIIEKCMGWVVVYPFLGVFLLKVQKECVYMVMSDYLYVYIVMGGYF